MEKTSYWGKVRSNAHLALHLHYVVYYCADDGNNKKQAKQKILEPPIFF
ncbi:MAG: hypothetical protein ACUVT5_07685 [Candidatus Bathyarchaeales archaeon]